MKKIFLPYDIIRNDGIKLARKIHSEGFIPDIIYVSLRGGAYLGNVISEYFKLLKKKERPVFYAAVVARSYTDVRKHDKVMVDGWTYSPDHLRNGDKVLLVDDIFDSGRTINFLVNIILEKGIPRSDIKVVVHDYKCFSYKKNLPVTPDFYTNKYIIKNNKSDIWIHYLSHEILGLSSSEIEENYPNDNELNLILKEITDK